jgi:hypothetical protein
MEEQSQPPVTPAESQPPTQAPLKPHRGVVVLVLGILGIIPCFICGIIAWVMANSDLKEMDAGRMDPAGRGMTQAGKICGIIGVILAAVGLVIQLLTGLFVAGAAHQAM